MSYLIYDCKWLREGLKRNEKKERKLGWKMTDFLEMESSSKIMAPAGYANFFFEPQFSVL